MALVFPLLFSAIFGIIFFTNKTTDDAAREAEKQPFSILIKDDSGLIDASLVTAFGAKTTDNKSDGIAQVRDGSIDAFFYYPTSLDRANVEISARDVGVFDNGRYSAVAKLMLDQSVSANVNQQVRSVLGGSVGYNSLYYKDGAQYDGIRQLIAPGIFLVLFYILIAMFGNQLLSSTTEEKENRVIEIILTTIEAKTLIIGKIISLIFLAFIQALVILLPVVIAYVIFHDTLSLPSLDLTSIPLDPLRICIGFAVFAISFLLFTGLLVTIGAATPTAKEAGGFFGAVMMLLFGPLYAAPLFVSSPESSFVQFLSYFPFTAPIPLMLRNAVGNLSAPEAALAIGILAITTLIVIRIAVRVFRYGALEYNRRLSIKEILRRQ